LLAKYPSLCPDFFEDKNNLAEKMNFILGIISQVRNTRQSLGISWANQLDIFYETQNPEHSSALELAKAFVQEMAKVAKLSPKPDHLARPLNVFVVESSKFYVPLLNLVDIEKIKSGISAKISKLDKDILGLESRLNSPNFIQNASKEKITETKDSLDQLLAQKQTFIDEISALS